MKNLKNPTKLVFVTCFLCLIFKGNLLSQTYPAGFSQTNAVAGLTNPTAMAFAPDGRIFICQQAGALKIVKNGALLATPAITLSVNSSGERGLLGIAFDPNFNTNHFIYLYYTTSTIPIHNRISRFVMAGDLVNLALPVPETVLMDLDNLSSATNHNGGGIAFGPDEKLYIAVGENASSANAQSLSNRLGKILRINSDGTFPADNPTTFPGIVGSTTGANRAIWCVGLRNPYTLSFQPVTGTLFINDVGQDTWEEINDATIGGKNYGWPTTEGSFTQANYPNFTLPIHTYIHGTGVGQGLAITGGTFFNPTSTNYPFEYRGKYFFLDYSKNWIEHITNSNPAIAKSNKSLKIASTNSWARAGFATSISGSSVGLTSGPDGNLYYLSRTAGALVKIINDALLPVKLVSFYSKISDNKSIILDWQTSAELNSSSFEIQKSNDIQKWEKIGEIKALGNSNEKNNYQFIDLEPINGNNYYRLKQIDMDGKFEFSKTIIQHFDNSTFKIFPNPALNYIMVESEDLENEKVEIINQMGQVFDAKLKVDTKKIDISNLPKGKYFVKFKNNTYPFYKN